MAVPDNIRKPVGYASLGFGALAILTPRLFLGVYGVPDEENVRLMTRLWGTRNVVLGVLTLTLRDTEDRRTLMTAAAAMDAVDTLLIATSSVPARARAMARSQRPGSQPRSHMGSPSRPARPGRSTDLLADLHRPSLTSYQDVQLSPLTCRPPSDRAQPWRAGCRRGTGTCSTAPGSCSRLKRRATTQ